MYSFLIEFEGYRARVERDRDGLLHGRVMGIDDAVNFKAVTMRQVESKFAAALSSYLEGCRARGVDPQKPTDLEF